jgi:hypothetical protein
MFNINTSFMYKFITQILLLFLACQSGTSSGQQLISSSGNSHESSGYSISWSLGELVIDTWSTQNITVTNGFHQPVLTVTNVFKEAPPDLIINLYPNPTSDLLIVESNSEGRFDYYLFNFDGKLLASDLFELERKQINFQHYTPGIYLLRILSDNELVGVYQIIKK